MTKAEDTLKQEINHLQGRVARQAVRMARIRRVVERARGSEREAIQEVLAILKEERAEEPV